MKTSLLYKLDTLLLKQKKLPVLGFFFRIRTRGIMLEKKLATPNTGRFFASIELYLIHNLKKKYVHCKEFDNKFIFKTSFRIDSKQNVMIVRDKYFKEVVV